MKQTKHKANFYHKFSETKIQCDLCPRQCVIPEGHHGFCFVRQNHNQEMILTTYGRSSGFCIDPIEKKPLNHFYPGQPILSFGTAGCNLGCKFCQNWDISKAKELDKAQEQASPLEIAIATKKLNCLGIAFTYNDPVIFAEYAMDIAKECRQFNLKTVAVTAGYIMPEARKIFFKHIDAANIDLKAFSQTFYKKICMANLEPILETLLYLKHETDVWFELTNLIIPQNNDNHKELDEMTKWIAKHLGPDIPLHFTAFHPDYKMMDIPKTEATSLLEAYNIAKQNGLHYVYTGNIYDSKTGSTYCPSCKKCIIERNWYELGNYHITNGCCKFCNTKIAGKFSDKAGEWGRKRIAVPGTFFRK